MNMSNAVNYQQPPWHAPASNWHISGCAASEIQNFEGLVLTRYQDAGGIWTIGYGHVTDDKTLESITEIQAENLFEADIDLCRRAIIAQVAAEISQGQFDALTSWIFNLGRGRFSESSIAKALNAGQVVAAADEMAKYDLVNGKILPGLNRRRQWERALMLAT
jgi:lysozyme